MVPTDARYPLLDFVCPLSWGDLPASADPKRRHCPHCQKMGLWCDSEEEAERQEPGACVAFAVETAAR